MRIFPIILAATTISACSKSLEYVQVNPAWSPPGGKARAEYICKAKAYSAGGYDYADVIINQVETEKNCMASYGYVKRWVTKD